MAGLEDSGSLLLPGLIWCALINLREHLAVQNLSARLLGWVPSSSNASVSILRRLVDGLGPA